MTDSDKRIRPRMIERIETEINREKINWQRNKTETDRKKTNW